MTTATTNDCCLPHKGKAPIKREEHRFETNLAVAASYLKCYYIKIPDPIYDSKRVREKKDGREQKSRRRPFDGMLVVNADAEHAGGIYACEAKFGSNTLEKHQKDYLTIVHNINKMAYVIRMRCSGKREIFTVEWPEKCVLFETESLIDFIEWFKELSRIKK